MRHIATAAFLGAALLTSCGQGPTGGALENVFPASDFLADPPRSGATEITFGGPPLCKIDATARVVVTGVELVGPTPATTARAGVIRIGPGVGNIIATEGSPEGWLLESEDYEPIVDGYEVQDLCSDDLGAKTGFDQLLVIVSFPKSGFISRAFRIQYLQDGSPQYLEVEQTTGVCGPAVEDPRC